MNKRQRKKLAKTKHRRLNKLLLKYYYSLVKIKEEAGTLDLNALVQYLNPEFLRKRGEL